MEMLAVLVCEYATPQSRGGGRGFGGSAHAVRMISRFWPVLTFEIQGGDGRVEDRLAGRRQLGRQQPPGHRARLCITFPWRCGKMTCCSGMASSDDWHKMDVQTTTSSSRSHASLR